MERRARVKAWGFIIISGVERFWNSSLSFNGEAQGVYDCGRWRGRRWFDRWLTSFVWSWQSEVWTSRVAIECFTAFGWETSKTEGVLVARLEAYIWDLYVHTFSTFLLMRIQERTQAKRSGAHVYPPILLNCKIVARMQMLVIKLVRRSSKWRTLCFKWASAVPYWDLMVVVKPPCWRP